MKNFLRHLAGAVVRPQTSVHPFPESIYPATVSRTTASLPSPAFTTLEQDLTSTATAPALTRTGNSAASAPVDSPSDATTRSHFQPLLPNYRGEDPRINLGRSSQPSERDASERSFSKHHLVPVEGDPTREGVERVVAAHATQGDAPVTRALPLIPIPAQPVAAPMKPARQAQAPVRSYAETPHTDDIQIHIGRVEVIAVQQQEVRRQPAPPARKGLSLDDYLSRRNGRLG